MTRATSDFIDATRKTCGDYRCVSCGAPRLQPAAEALACPGCGRAYPVRLGVPSLLPTRAQLREIGCPEAGRHSLANLQAVYDRAYSHSDLMGTDLDAGYDRSTKEALLRFTGIRGGGRLLDLGAGVGNLWKYVEPGVEGHAVDLSPVGAARIRRSYASVMPCVAIAEHLPYPDGYFHAVVAADSIEHTFAPEAALREVRRVLQPGGILAASFPIPQSLRKWGLNEFILSRPRPALALRLLRVVALRTLLFGKPNFQPLDRDKEPEAWVEMLERAGFRVATCDTLPVAPKLPIVALVQARAEGRRG